MPLLLATAGCTVVLSPGEKQCETADDCTARGFTGAVCNAGVCEEAPVVDPTWGCLGNVVETTPDKTKTVDLAIGLVFAGSKAPVTEVTVDVCDKLDVQCMGMATGFPKGIKPDAKGIVSFSVLQGFDGFVRITADDPMNKQVVDSRVYVGRPLITAPEIKEVWLLPPSDYQLLAAAAKLTVDPTRGTAILLAHDCQGNGGSDVVFKSSSADAESTQFYLVNQFPATPPAASATDVDGYGGFFNMPTGPALAQTYLAKDDTFIGESSFQILADTISYVLIAPTPK